MRLRSSLALSIASLAIAIPSVGGRIHASTSIHGGPTTTLPRELKFLEPYVVEAKTTYYRWGERSDPTSEQYFATRKLTLRGLSRNEVTDKFDKVFLPADGWFFRGCSISTSGFRELPPSPALQHGIISVDVSEYIDHMDKKTRTFTLKTVVNSTEQLSASQVLMVRLQHIGQDPFKARD